jgi:5'-3' exonuclease
MARLHLIDGTFELFRQHFSKRPPHPTKDGRDLKATVGLASSLLALLHEKDEAVTHLGVAFDNPIRSFRNDLFDGYKTEAGVPPELLAQFDPAEDAVRALGVVVWSMDRYEADDALATMAKRFGDSTAVEQVRILTPDKDLGQSIHGRRVVQVDRMRKNEIDEDALRAARGVGPESIPDYLALVGDTADGIPGLPGFGEKSAALLLGTYKRLEDIPRDASTWAVKPRGADKLAATLAARFSDALLYRRLATLVTEVPLEEDLEALAWRGVPKEAFGRWCASVGAERLLSRPERWAEGT